MTNGMRILAMSVCVHCDLDLRDMILSQGHDTPLGNQDNNVIYEQRSNMTVRSYKFRPDMDFGSV